MNLADMFTPEDKVEIKISDLYRFMSEAARAEIIRDIAIVETNPAKAGAIIKKLAERR